MTTKTILTACNLTAGQPASPDPLAENYRQLVYAVLLQAWQDAHDRRRPHLAARAQHWLRQPATRALGSAIGVELP